MVQPSNVTPISPTLLSSSNDNTFDDAIDSSTRPKSPSSSSSSKRTRGRPVGSKNKPKLTLVIDQDNKHTQKPIFIQIPKNSDVIETLVQFAYDYQISITVQSASGSIMNVTLRDSESITSTFITHGPFTLVSLVGTCINNKSCTVSSLSNLDIDCVFNISFCSNIGQSFIGVVGGKVVAGDDVVVTATIFNNSENNKNEN